MFLLKEFIKKCDKYEIKEAESVMMYFYRENKKLVSRDELEDFQQDIILEALTSYEKWDNSKSKFATYLTHCLKNIKNDLISRYTGIKVTQYSYAKALKEGSKITINLCSYSDEIE